MSGIEISVISGQAAQDQRSCVFQPRVRRTLGIAWYSVDQPRRGCVHRRAIAGGRNPVGIGPSVGICFHLGSPQGCANPGLNSASPLGLGKNNTAFEEVVA